MTSVLRDFHHIEDEILTQYSPLLRRLLYNRGIRTIEEAEYFLKPDYKNLHNPFLMHDMERAVVRIFEAIELKEKIAIFADYDCDGIPGAVLMSDFFEKIGYTNIEVYIPDRHYEGYGLNKEAITGFRDREVKLIITIDLGITNVEEIALSEGFGMNVIVTDHHLPKEIIPKAFALVNPKIPLTQSDGVVVEYPDPMLCGAGVAFKLVSAFLIKYREYFKVSEGWEKWLLDMAGLATLSDMVPLVKENRILAFYGLKVLQKTRRPGLLNLLLKTKIDPRHLTEDDLTFMITPRINAASRMDDPKNAFELLQTKDSLRGNVLADHLCKINDERKVLVAHIMKEVKKSLSEREIREVVVIGNPKWRIGVLGLVASKIIEEYKKPAFVWGLEGGDIIKGSCRSDGSINLVTLMAKIPEDSLLGFGGHELAGGFSVSHEQIHTLEEKLCSFYSEVRYSLIDTENKGVEVDAPLSLDEVNEDTYKIVEILGPFGTGNPKPTFILENIKISSVKEFGKEKNHLEICFENSRGRIVKAIKFFDTRNGFGESLVSGEHISLIATIEQSFFAGRKEIRLRIVDIHRR